MAPALLYLQIQNSDRGGDLSRQEPDQHPPTVKYVRKNSKVRPRQRHRDGSLSNRHLSEDRGLYRGGLHTFVRRGYRLKKLQAEQQVK